ncbi:hypothetical protein CAAN3_03S06546 [[Candida] anglica]
MNNTSMGRSPHISIISGGTATNELVSLFYSLSHNITYILPISDNGGSTSEVIRVIGGPAIGDIRSRLTRLIPEHHDSLRRLLSFRLSSDPVSAKREWNEIVEGSHALWGPINPATKEIIRAFFIHVHTELLKRSRMQSSSSQQFRYELANVGNLFLTGVRTFVGSLDSAIELFARMTGVHSMTQVLPCINTNFTYHISALLENGVIITGQSQISHPSEGCENKLSVPSREFLVAASPTDIPTPDFNFNQSVNLSINDLTLNTPSFSQDPTFNEPGPELEFNVSRASSICSSSSEQNIPQYTHPELKKSQLHFNKSSTIEPLKSPIERIFYISPYGEEILPTAHNRVTTSILQADAVVYSIGSLMTSVIPVVILKGVGRALLNSTAKSKILLLNGCHDRETEGMDAEQFIESIVTSALYSMGKKPDPNIAWTPYVTHLVHLKDSQIEVNKHRLTERGIICVEVDRLQDSDYYDPVGLEEVLRDIVNSS